MRSPCDCDDCVAWNGRVSERAAMEAELAKLRAENAQLRDDRTRLLTELVDKRTAVGDAQPFFDQPAAVSRGHEGDTSRGSRRGGGLVIFFACAVSQLPSPLPAHVPAAGVSTPVAVSSSSARATARSLFVDSRRDRLAPAVGTPPARFPAEVRPC